METVRIAVAGAGMMARRRLRALLADPRARLCGIASRRLESARSLAAQFGEIGEPDAPCFDDYRRLAEVRPDALLVEVPHAVQDEIVLWALEAGLHVLIGAPLSYTAHGGETILRRARERGRVVEAGFEARYRPSWEAARDLLRRGEIGRPVAVRAIALWDGDPESWYYDERRSGGMPLTHMTYCFLNPLRWLFGDPTHVSAFANRVKHTGPDHVREETCVASLLFPDGLLASLTAGYVKGGEAACWHVSVIGTEGILEIAPTEMDRGSLRLFRGPAVQEMDFSSARDPFEVQAEAFLDAVIGDGGDGGDQLRNKPEAALGDLLVAEAIVTSAREMRTVVL